MFNNSATIERCLRSIFDQVGVDFEVIVIDDDSSDDSVPIAEKLLRERQGRLIRNQHRLGISRNHNRCVEYARGELIQFVHGDDWLLPGALQRLAACFQDDESVGLSFAPRRVLTDNLRWQAHYGDLHDGFRGLQRRNAGPALVLQIAIHGVRQNWIGEPTAVMFRRKLAMDVGVFRTDVYQLLDLDLWLRLMLRADAGFVADELSVRAHTSATASAQNVSSRRDWLDRLRILSWLVVDPASPYRVRVCAGAWWLPVWMRLWLRVAVHGPDRWTRAAVLFRAPFDELIYALQMRRVILSSPQ